MKTNIMNGFLITLALVLSQIIPSLGEIPDFSVIILIIIIILNKDYKKALLYGMLLGVLSFLTNKSPNSQIPSLIDKITTANVTYLILYLFKNIDEYKLDTIVLFIGSSVSNIIFYFLSFYMNGLMINNVLIISEVMFLIVISVILNTIIGKMMIKLVRKCLGLNNHYNSNY